MSTPSTHSLRFYNTLTRELEPFVPLTPDEVKLYVCGPTVYDVPHLGHARCYLTWDVLYRFLCFLGYDVTYVRNITDVDDKILARARENNEPPEALTARFTKVFEDNMAALGLLSPTHQPRATAHVESMIAFIQTLIEKGYAYATPEGDVYYDTSQKTDYGKLCKQNLDDLQAGARIQVGESKKNALDFALWKSIGNGSENAATEAISWDTPWGKGRPGWHIECSAMIYDTLGEQIDIHAGGYDLVFPHHENEIAQSEARTDKAPFAQYWLHNGFVNVSGEKMSKSLGNFATLADVMAHYDADTIRYFVLTNHYRVPVDFNPEAMAGAKNRVEKIKAKVADLLEKQGIEADTLIQEAMPALHAGYHTLEKDPQFESDNVLGKLILDWLKGMLSDMNTAQALASVNTLLSEAAKLEDSEQRAQTLGVFLATSATMGFSFHIPTDKTNTGPSEDTLKRIHTTLSTFLSTLRPDTPATATADLETTMTTLLAIRQDARQAKQWDVSDAIREQLTALNVQVIDHKDKPSEWLVK
jgi:cysteinyl-tRNA synthetase